MYITTCLPDGSRDIYRLDPDDPPGSHAWAVVVCGQRRLGHITGPGWVVHRYAATQEYARSLVQDLERTCLVERAVVLPTTAHPGGAPFTAIGFWDGDEVALVGIVAGELEVTGGEDVSLGGPWHAHVWAPDVDKATVEAYRAMDEAAAARLAEPAPEVPGQEVLPGV